MEHGFEQRQELRAHAGCAPGEAGEFECEHQSHYRQRHRLANSGGVGEHDIALQGFKIGLFDTNAGEFAKSGVDAVNRCAVGDDGGDGLGAELDGGVGGGVKL